MGSAVSGRASGRQPDVCDTEHVGLTPRRSPRSIPMTLATDRIDTERQFHDRQARGRATTFRRRPDDLRFSDDQYLDHESWVRPAFAKLGPLAGKRALDYGCGHGMTAVVMARRGGAVSAF